ADVGADETVVDDEDAARLHPILNVGQTGAQGRRQAAVVAFVHHEDVDGGEVEGADVEYVNGNKAGLEDGRLGAGAEFVEVGEVPNAALATEIAKRADHAVHVLGGVEGVVQLGVENRTQRDGHAVGRIVCAGDSQVVSAGRERTEVVDPFVGI